MRLRHKEKGYVIKVDSEFGEPKANKRGFVTIKGGSYKGCTNINQDVLEEKFRRVS